jgi:hypothetical protein
MAKKGLVVGGLTALLIGFLSGTYINLVPSDLANSYICTSNGKIGVFDKISSTGTSGSWRDTAGSHTASCAAKWQPLKDYLQGQGIQAPIQENAPGAYLCGLEGCTPLEEVTP